MPSFEFDISSGRTDRLRFRQFIDELRRTLMVPEYAGHSPFVMQEAATLPEQVDDNPATMDLTLRSDNGREVHEVTLILRTDNLYVVGFRPGGQGPAYELSHDNGRSLIIQDAEQQTRQLPFHGSYRDGGLGELNQEDDILGWSLVGAAIENLANYVGGTGQVRDRSAAIALRRLIVNFIESIRLNPIADRVHMLMSTLDARDRDDDRPRPRDDPPNPDRLRLSALNIAKIKNWGQLSTALRVAVNDNIGGAGPGPFANFVEMGIGNAFRAATVLGMVLIVSGTQQQQQDPGRRRFRRSTGAAAAATTGLALVDVLGVRIINIDGEDPGDLYGTVSITDGLGTVTLFHRERQDTQSVGPNGWADLSWPSRSISAADDWHIDVHLMDRDSFPDLSPDDEVARGRVSWNSRDAMSWEWGAVQSKVVAGEYGSVEVRYVALADAVVAAVSVVLLDGDGEDVPDVYGTIVATTAADDGGEPLRYKLFDQPRSQDAKVPRNTAIPLQREFVSVPLGSELRVHADLMDADRFPDLSPDDRISLGDVVLTPFVDGCSSAEITGTYGKVRVDVTWSVSF